MKTQHIPKPGEWHLVGNEIAGYGVTATEGACPFIEEHTLPASYARLIAAAHDAARAAILKATGGTQ